MLFILLFVFSVYYFPVYIFPEIPVDKPVGYKEAYVNWTLCAFYYPAVPNTGVKSKLYLNDKNEWKKS